MSLKMTKRDRNRNSSSPEKENIIKELCLILESVGYAVRRERLKQGHGWKVTSGSCRLGQDRFIFVDRRLTQGDQIAFLLNKIQSLSKVPDWSILQQVSSITEGLVRAHLPDSLLQHGSREHPQSEEAEGL